MIEILENGIWEETSWESFEQMKEYTCEQKTWSDNNYNYVVKKFNTDSVLEVYRQKVKRCRCESCCKSEKTIFVYGSTKRQANEYIRTNVKTVTDGEQLRGYSKGNAILIVLPRELAEKYTGLKKGRVQKILIKSEVNEVTAMEITLLL